VNDEDQICQQAVEVRVHNFLPGKFRVNR